VALYKQHSVSVCAAQQAVAADRTIESPFEAVFAFERFKSSLVLLRQPCGG